jgi:multiple sugar transport system ATP-binding protein
MASVSIKSVVKSFGDTKVIHDISLDVADGEFCVFVGPSGCGKSTLLRMIAGLEGIDRGEIHIDGRMVNHLPPVDRDIAMVFQDYALYPHMTVRQNLSFALRMKGMPKARIAEKVQRAAEILQIQELLSRKPKALSGGQRQRVAMGRAMIREPKIFLFDEPLSNLDAKLRVDVRTEIKQLHQRSRATMIYVTHDQVEAMTLADRIVVLRGGNVEQVGTPAELYRYPASAFVASFIGSPAMNLVPCSATPVAVGLNVVVGPRDNVTLPFAGNEQIGPGHKLILGVRPEELELCDPADPGTTLRGTVDVVEPLGADTMVVLRIGSHAVTVRVKPSLRISPEDVVGVVVNPLCWSLFDAETGKAIHHA